MSRSHSSTPAASPFERDPDFYSSPRSPDILSPSVLSERGASGKPCDVWYLSLPWRCRRKILKHYFIDDEAKVSSLRKKGSKARLMYDDDDDFVQDKVQTGAPFQFTLKFFSQVTRKVPSSAKDKRDAPKKVSPTNKVRQPHTPLTALTPPAEER